MGAAEHAQTVLDTIQEIRVNGIPTTQSVEA
jgi:hypothetical protein